MAGYYQNPYGYQTPIGQGLENIAQTMFKVAMLRKQQEVDQAKMDFEREKYQTLELPMKQAQMAKYQAEADAKALEGKQMQAMPDTVARAFAGLTAPQLGQVRGFQANGNWGEAPVIPGLDNLSEGQPAGNWMPTFADPTTMQNVRIADAATALPGGKPDDYAKAMQGISQLLFAQGAQDGSVPVADIQNRGMAEAASGGKPLFGNPNSEGLVGDLFRGLVMNQNNPLANAQVQADQALAGERGATAGLRREQANTERAQQGKYNAEAANERANPGGKKGDMTQAQQMSREEKNQKIISARKKLQALSVSDPAKMHAAIVSGDKGFSATMALAQESLIGVPDPQQREWVNYLSGQGFSTGKGYTSAGKNPPAQGAVPQPAMDFYKANRGKPGIREQFIKKYGFDPEGA